MPKIKVFVTLDNKLEKKKIRNSYNGFLNKEKLVYLEDEKIVTISRKCNTITMIRKGKENSIFLTFEKEKKTDCFCKMKDCLSFQFSIFTQKLEQKENVLHLCYETKIEQEVMGVFELFLQYEVIE